MTFNLEWARDASNEITNSYVGNVARMNPFTGELERETVIHHEGPGYYNTPNSGWWKLMEILDIVGMLADDINRSDAKGLPLSKLGINGGQLVSPEEIDEALEIFRSDDFAVTKVLAAGGVQAVSILIEWVAWIVEAREHGGFIVN